MPRVKTPLLLQLEAVECGAACLGMILEYYGRVVPLTELRAACGVSRDGVKAGNVIKAAKKYGLNAKGFRENLDSALKLKCPYLAFWNFNHFLVVEGYDAKRKIVHLNDPGEGHRKVRLEEFDGSFTGVVMLFEPNKDFKKGGSKPSMLAAIQARFRHARASVLYLLLCGLVLAVPNLIIPAYTQIFVDSVLGEDRTDWLRPLILALLVTILFRVVVETVKYLLLRRLYVHLGMVMTSGFFWHLLKLPMSFYSQRFSGEIATRQKLNDTLAETLSGKLADTCLNIVLMVFSAALMFYYNAVLTLVGIALAAVNFYALRSLGRFRIDANARVRQEFGKVVGATIAPAIAGNHQGVGPGVGFLHALVGVVRQGHQHASGSRDGYPEFDGAPAPVCLPYHRPDLLARWDRGDSGANVRRRPGRLHGTDDELPDARQGSGRSWQQDSGDGWRPEAAG